MGQAERNKANGTLKKKMRFIHLIQTISKYNKEEIAKFLKHRFN